MVEERMAHDGSGGQEPALGRLARRGGDVAPAFIVHDRRAQRVKWIHHDIRWITRHGTHDAATPAGVSQLHLVPGRPEGGLRRTVATAIDLGYRNEPQRITIHIPTATSAVPQEDAAGPLLEGGLERDRSVGARGPQQHQRALRDAEEALLPRTEPDVFLPI